MNVKKTNNSVGQLMKFAREQYKISGVDMARELGISAAQYRRYERDVVDPPVRVILLMAEKFQLSTDALITGTTDKLEEGINQNLTIDVKPGETIKILVRGQDHFETLDDDDDNEGYTPIDTSAYHARQKRKKAS